MTWPPGAPPKDELRALLLAAHPWLADDELGPLNVDAGECEGCGVEPRLVQTCGPGARQLGRACATSEGSPSWCDGHQDAAAAALGWLARLPPDADDVARLWWVATGEVRLSSAGQRVIAALEEHQRISPARRLPDRQHLTDDQ